MARTKDERDATRVAISNTIVHGSVSPEMGIAETILELCRTVDDFCEETNVYLRQFHTDMETLRKNWNSLGNIAKEK